MSAEARMPVEGELIDFYDAVLRDQPYNSMLYLNSTLTSEGVNDTYDPSIVIRPFMAASYWPGGIEAYGRREYAMHSYNVPDDEVDLNSERIYSRKVILAASIGNKALQRYDENLPKHIKDFRDKAGYHFVPSVVEICRELNIPFSAILFSKVLESKVMPKDSRVAHLYFPLVIPPNVALSHMRRSVKRVVEEEKIQ